LSYEPHLSPSSLSPVDTGLRAQGMRTHVLLVIATGAVTAIVTALFIVLLQHRLGEQVTENLSEDLRQSVAAFSNLKTERLSALERENALLSELPTLKALMTSGDDRTIQDGASEFWQLSGNDLFALADPYGRIVAMYTKSSQKTSALPAELSKLVLTSDRQFLIDGKALYACSSRPLYFGNDGDGSLLGYVISGISMERTVREISEPTGVDASFLSSGVVVASTLDRAAQAGLTSPALTSATTLHPARVALDSAHYLAATEDLSPSATSSLQLVLLKSFGPAEAGIKRLDRLVLSTGVLAFLCGSILMIAVARLMTRPLEDLSRSVRAFAMGDSRYHVPNRGTQEVRQLSSAFASMREEIQQKNRALIESERLATIGRMASSVSHDLRHYLAAVYANSEFLASGNLSDEERAEIFGDIRAAVHGTTEMIESLLIFSRTGTSLRKTLELIAPIADCAMTMLKAHPDAEGVKLSLSRGNASATTAMVDSKQMERALYNLLLNACQAARTSSIEPSVSLVLATEQDFVVAKVEDNGMGVSDTIRSTLFDPFVSEGRQKGTGLGLTLSSCIAEEHGGEVILLESQPGRTVFQLRIARNFAPDSPPSETTTSGKVIIDETVST
jgi:signal transduction histidine kinase